MAFPAFDGFYAVGDSSDWPTDQTEATDGSCVWLVSSALLPSGIPVNAFFPPVGKGCFFLMPTIPGADIPLPYALGDALSRKSDMPLHGSPVWRCYVGNDPLALLELRVGNLKEGATIAAAFVSAPSENAAKPKAMAAFLFQNLDCKYGTWRLFLVTRSAMLAPRRVSLTTREYPTSRHVVLPHTGAAALNHTLPGGAPLQYENYTEYFSLSLDPEVLCVNELQPSAGGHRVFLLIAPTAFGYKLLHCTEEEVATAEEGFRLASEQLRVPEGGAQELEPQVYFALIRHKDEDYPEKGWLLTRVVNGPYVPPTVQHQQQQPQMQPQQNVQQAAEAIQDEAEAQAVAQAVAREDAEAAAASVQGGASSAAAAAVDVAAPGAITVWQPWDWNASPRAAAAPQATPLPLATETASPIHGEAAPAETAPQPAAAATEASCNPSGTSAQLMPSAAAAAVTQAAAAAAKPVAVKRNKTTAKAASPASSPDAAAGKPPACVDRAALPEQPVWRPTGPAPDAASRPPTAPKESRVAKARWEAADASRKAAAAWRAARTRAPRPAAAAAAPEASTAAHEVAPWDAAQAAETRGTAHEQEAPSEFTSAAACTAVGLAQVAAAEAAFSKQGSGACAGASVEGAKPPQAPATPEILSRRTTCHGCGGCNVCGGAGSGTTQAAVSLQVAAWRAAQAAAVRLVA